MKSHFKIALAIVCASFSILTYAETGGGCETYSNIELKEKYLPGRSVEKITNDYAKDASKIKDIVRNTIITEEGNINTVVSSLKERDAKIKILDSVVDPLGYSGINANLTTEAGLLTEIQINSPGMIYGKEQESISRILLGDETYNELAVKIKLPGGKGHEYYEQWRSIYGESPVKMEIEKKVNSIMMLSGEP